VHTLRVRYHETDPQEFLFNSRYLEYADVAMAEFFRHLGWPYPLMLQEGFDPSVVNASLSFENPARLDDLVDIHVECTRVGTSSFALEFDMRIGQERVCRVESVYVNVDPLEAASRPIPSHIADSLRTAQVREPIPGGEN
jgi:acyl-CoA thioester hydrolase